MNRHLILATAVLLGTAGCGGDAEDKAAERPSASRSGSPAPTTPKPTTPKPTKTKPALDAEDGTHLKRCSKGPCEVLVTPDDEIPTPPELGVGPLKVESVGAAGVTFVSVSGSGFMSTFSGQLPGMTSQMNDLKITTVAIEGRKAVVRLHE